ncbi:MAG: tRNA uridine-5-carboxymethylaminomethyl(34) synthesis GTPase MnmE [Puniceicoccales bacterium]|nr:tRNA uridine-5-carboxymethylaminomethyl(34) synthesis GTPase MnmE [Puniceicoccales bacterium]
MTKRADTIVAPATAPTAGALAIVRLSGPLCPEIARAAFGNRQNPPPTRRATLGVWHDTGGNPLDQCILVLYAAPHSYTGEAVLEITCHGNPFIVSRILGDCLKRGCRSAEPGEFTRRAFLNGRIDLAQAEAVVDTIHARSERALAIAQRLLSGELGRKVAAWTDTLIGILASLEAYIDFPEEDLPDEERGGPAAALRALATELSRAADTARLETVLRDGARIVISGAPNAGKSSLLNALLGENRALVSATSGTTRDFIRERMSIGAHFVQIVDTAGLRPPGVSSGADSEAEHLGMARSHEQIAGADFHLLILDASAPPPNLPQDFPGILPPSRTLLVLNKIDLPTHPATIALWQEFSRIRLSAKTGEGIADFKQSLAQKLENEGVLPNGDELVVGTRHASHLRHAASHLKKAADTLHGSTATELAASDARLALESLGEIIGRVDNEQLLDKLFSSFCIGK